VIFLEKLGWNGFPSNCKASVYGFTNGIDFSYSALTSARYARSSIFFCSSCCCFCCLFSTLCEGVVISEFGIAIIAALNLFKL
jgi:hypothetical protein